MKNKILLVLISFLAIFMVGCTKEGYKEISYEKLNSMVSEEKTFALFIGKTTCTACDAFKEILNDSYKGYSKEFPIYYIDLDKLTKEEKIEFTSKYNFSGTPTVVVLEKGKFFNSNIVLKGSDEYTNMIEAFKVKGYIR